MPEDDSRAMLARRVETTLWNLARICGGISSVVELMLKYFCQLILVEKISYP
jgi:hypothetical protein